MTHAEKHTIREWTITTLVGIIGFLGGSNITGLIMDSHLDNHKLDQTAHPVFQNQIKYLEERHQILFNNHEQDVQVINQKLDAILKEIREIKESSTK